MKSLRAKNHGDSGARERPGCTIATLFTPLHARYSRPFVAATMLRTTPPPEGIASVLKLSDLGSNRTSVFGFTPDSLYQTFPFPLIAMP